MLDILDKIATDNREDVATRRVNTTLDNLESQIKAAGPARGRDAEEQAGRGAVVAAALRAARCEITERDRTDVVRDAAREQERRVGGLADVVRREELRAPLQRERRDRDDRREPDEPADHRAVA